LLKADVAREFLCEVVSQARSGNLTSDEHFTIDGTLIEARARHSSAQRIRNVSSTSCTVRLATKVPLRGRISTSPSVASC
jgi:hypothetical protein